MRNAQLPLSIRLIAENDVPGLVAAGMGSEPFLRDRSRRQDRGDGALLGAWQDQAPAGVVYLWESRVEHPVVAALLPGIPHVNQLYVAPHLRSEGIGSRLLGDLERRAVLRGHSRLALGVTLGNVRARRLYEKLHYRDWGQGVIRWQWTEETGVRRSEDLAILTKKLAPPSTAVTGLDESGPPG